MWSEWDLFSGNIIHFPYFWDRTHGYVALKGRLHWPLTGFGNREFVLDFNNHQRKRTAITKSKTTTGKRRQSIRLLSRKRIAQESTDKSRPNRLHKTVKVQHNKIKQPYKRDGPKCVCVFDLDECKLVWWDFIVLSSRREDRLPWLNSTPAHQRLIDFLLFNQSVLSDGIALYIKYKIFIAVADCQ